MDEGVTYGSYLLLGRLSRGGMADVFLARRMHDAPSDTLFAVKRAFPELWSNAEFVRMFQDEVRVGASLTHPNICGIRDVGEADGQLFIVMDYVHGKDLRTVGQRARRGAPLPFGHIASIMARIARALQFAHERTDQNGEPLGIVHRDVSPQNILLSFDGVPTLIDFGIAKSRVQAAQTEVGVIKGKLAYMSPEQARGDPVDARTDVFALGAVLYELCTGCPPFQGSSTYSTLRRIARARYRDPLSVRPDVPARLAAIIRRSLVADRDGRYPSAAALAADLEAYLADEDYAVSTGSLAALMRGLFAEDYAREMGLIERYRRLRLPRSTGVPPPRPQRARAIEKTWTGSPPRQRWDDLPQPRTLTFHAAAKPVVQSRAEAVEPSLVTLCMRPRVEAPEEPTMLIRGQALRHRLAARWHGLVLSLVLGVTLSGVVAAAL